MGAANPQELLWHLMQADEFGVKLEAGGNDYVWEFFPSPLHQGVVSDIYRSLRPSPGGGPTSDRKGLGFYTLRDISS
jgi:hypothetical protein